MTEPTTDRIDLRLPAHRDSIPLLRRAARAFAEKHGYRDANSVGLAVSEAATNAVQHAYRDAESGDVRLVACVRRSELVVVVRDWGTGMRPRTDTPGLGLGLPTIATLVGELEVEAAEGAGTLLRMHFHRAAERAA
jgi:serine/threonine-protein kinase RsbW/stage II sporulation protein AB (anti-sigma F factor)